MRRAQPTLERSVQGQQRDHSQAGQEQEDQSVMRRQGFLPTVLRTVREFFYGLTGYEIAETARQRRAACEQVFVLALVGNLLGVPIPQSYYSLGLLPYLVTGIPVWKRRVLREKDLTEVLGHELS